MGREEHCKQISLVCVGSAPSVWATLGLLQLTVVCAFPVYTAQALLGYRPKQALHFMHFPGLSCSGSCSRVLRKCTDLAGRVFCALPRSKQLRRPGAWQAHCPRWCRSISVSQVCHESAVSGVLCVSSGELISGCNPPGRCQPSRSQEDMVSNWEPAHSLVEYAISGAEITPCLLALAVTHLPLCFWWGKGPVRSQLALLWYSLNPLFCEQARLHLMLELYIGSFSHFFLSLWLSHSLGCYLMLAPSDCPQGIQVWSLP